jgi:hypothetical protein
MGLRMQLNDTVFAWNAQSFGFNGREEGSERGRKEGRKERRKETVGPPYLWLPHQPTQD